MPRFKKHNQGQTVLLPASFDRKTLPGTPEYILNYLVDEKLGLTTFHHKYNNDERLGHSGKAAQSNITDMKAPRWRPVTA